MISAFLLFIYLKIPEKGFSSLVPKELPCLNLIWNKERLAIRRFPPALALSQKGIIWLGSVGPMASMLDLIEWSPKIRHFMEYLIILSITIFIIFILILVLLGNSRSSYSFHRNGKILTIVHPLKNEEVNLESELKSWNIKGFRRLWRGKIYSLNMELHSGKWKKIYSRSLDGTIDQLITYLESTAFDKKTESIR